MHNIISSAYRNYFPHFSYNSKTVSGKTVDCNTINSHKQMADLQSKTQVNTNSQHVVVEECAAVRARQNTRPEIFFRRTETVLSSIGI